jgi:DNA-binding response OmpR family regulator
MALLLLSSLSGGAAFGPMTHPAYAKQALSVLVVDDDPEFLEAMQDTVRRLGHSGTVARDGRQAWTMYQAEHFDVILADWRMPRMDNLELCQKVRGASLLRPYTHFILVTGHDDEAHFRAGVGAGADDYITKPLDIDDLDARLQAVRRQVVLSRRLAAGTAPHCHRAPTSPSPRPAFRSSVLPRMWWQLVRA